MKILILGSNAAIAAIVMQQLRERHPEHDIEAREASEVEHENLAGYDFLLETRPEPVVMPIMAPEREAWPEYLTSRSRYHRTPKWKRNNSGSKYF
jgi:hypothetical protein